MRGRLGRLVRWHSQNLNEKNGRLGAMWRAGRAWFYLFPQTEEEAEHNYKQGKVIGIEWTIPTRHLHIEVGRGGYDDYDFTFSIACKLFAFWIHFENFIPKKWHKHWDPYSERVIGLTWFAGSLRWRFWTHPHEWSSDTPKWKDGSFDPMDFLLGCHDFKSTQLQRPTEVAFVMPEGAYVGTVEFKADTWKRKRWPWPRTVYRAYIEVPNPPKFAGKGENSWDCDDDGFFGMTCEARTFHQAIQAYEGAVYERRAKYGAPSKEAVQ